MVDGSKEQLTRRALPRGAVSLEVRALQGISPSLTLVGGRPTSECT